MSPAFTWLYILLHIIEWIVCTSSSSSTSYSNTNTTSSTRILFGSCNKEYLNQPLWPNINQRDPDIWIWTGDIVYQDRPNKECFKALYDYINPFNPEIDEFHCRMLGKGAKKPNQYHHTFNLQLQNPGYQQLVNNKKTKIIGIWDDHDFGHNDGCCHNPFKQQAKDALLKFLEIPLDDPIRNRDGVYSFHTFTFGSTKNPLIIDIYLMDIRWFSDPKKDILFGDEQWEWLDNKMRERSSSKQVNISLFVSGVQILPFYRGYWSEAWAGKSAVDRMKFMEAILNYNISNPILISGDVHWGEQMRYNCKNKMTNEYKSLYEITSSGLTHSWGYTYPRYWVLLKNLAHLLSADGAIIGLTNDLNFGEIEVIDTDDDEDIDNIYLRVYGVDGVILEIDLMDGQYQNIDEDGKGIIDKHVNDSNANGNEWICVGFNQPSVWRSRLYLAMAIALILCALMPIVFVVTGGFFGFCCCCCCGRYIPCKTKPRKQKTN